jgi:SAM-dependent methyltransferase
MITSPDDLLVRLTACPSCQATDITPFFECPVKDAAKHPIDGILFEMLGVPQQPLRYDVCRACGLLFLNPRWNSLALGRLYGEENVYRRAALRSFRIRSGRPEATERDYFRFIDGTIDTPDDAHPVHRARAAWVMSHATDTVKTVVDVGAGFGAAQKALEAEGLYYQGFESSAEMVRLASTLGRTLKCVPFAAVPQALSAPVDLVYTAQFFEHVDTPVECMTILRDALRDSGYLFIDVPACHYLTNNFHSFLGTAGQRRHYMNWGHMLQFDHVSLGNTMRRAGYEPFAHRYVGSNVWMLGKKRPEMPVNDGYQRPNLREMALNVRVIDPLLEPVNLLYRRLRTGTKRALVRAGVLSG